MNREIKFRAWDKGKRQMREVTGINWYDEYLWVDETPMSGDKLPIESTPLMQFTGLLDKNGVPIYEGDICLISERTCEIVWCNGAYKIMEMKSMFEGAVDGWLHELHRLCECKSSKRIDSAEVIGNIYQNPDLL